MDLFTDGVFYIPLEKVPSPDFLIPAISESLEFGLDQIALHWEAREQLINFLNNRSVLLILDGYEHLIDDGKFLTDLLQRTAHVKLLVTSRQKINVQGEWALLLSGLPVPKHWERETSNGGSSLDLFIARARQANLTLNLSDAELDAALQICQQVEGFPLAVELAASWTALLSCAEIAEEISKSFSFLASQSLDVSEKHRSLEAAFNYSWQMLEAGQREKLARLSVFRGGFTRQAANRVANADWINLTDLLNQSLVCRVSGGRFDMHRMIHHFTQDKLKVRPEVLKDIRDKHSRYYLGYLRDVEKDLMNENMTVTRKELRPEIENLRVAINWAVLHWDTEAAAQAVKDYFSFYVVHGWHEGVTAFDQLAAWIQKNTPTAPQEIYRLYLSCRAHQAWFCSNLSMTEECEELSRECLQPVIECDMKRELALCLHNLGVSAEFRGDYEISKDLLIQSIELGEKDPFVVVPSFYLWLGYVHFLLGDYEDGMISFKTCYKQFMESNNLWGSSFALSKMGLAADGLGDHISAMKYFQEAYQIFLDTGDIAGQAYSLSRMSIGSNFLEDYSGAIEFGEQALALFREIGHNWGIYATLGHLGFANLGLEKTQEAQQLFYKTLEQTSHSQMAPLSLYALAGIASTFLLGEDGEEGWELFQYVQSHPRMPALYTDVAKRWFQNKKRFDAGVKTDVGDNAALLDEVIRVVLEKAPERLPPNPA